MEKCPKDVLRTSEMESGSVAMGNGTALVEPGRVVLVKFAVSGAAYAIPGQIALGKTS